jgi:hypothetical protein
VVITQQVEFEIASDGQGNAPNRVLIPDVNGFHKFQNGVQDTFGSRVRSVELHLINKSMPKPPLPTVLPTAIGAIWQQVLIRSFRIALDFQGQ